MVLFFDTFDLIDMSLSWDTAVFDIFQSYSILSVSFHFWVFLHLTKVLPLTWATPKTCLPLHVFIPAVSSIILNLSEQL